MRFKMLACLVIALTVSAFCGLAQAQTIIFVGRCGVDAGQDPLVDPSQDFYMIQFVHNMYPAATIVYENHRYDDLDPADPVDQPLIAELTNADLIIILRDSQPTGQVGDPLDPETILWNGLPTPLLLMDSHVCRHNRWQWYATAGGPVGVTFDTVGVTLPTDPLYNNINTGTGQVRLYDLAVPGWNTGMQVFPVGTLPNELGVGGQVIATMDDAGTPRVVAARWNTGDTMAGGWAVGNPRIYLNQPDLGANNDTLILGGDLSFYTADGLQMLANALNDLLPAPFEISTLNVVDSNPLNNGAPPLDTYTNEVGVLVQADAASGGPPTQIHISEDNGQTVTSTAWAASVPFTLSNSADGVYTLWVRLENGLGNLTTTRTIDVTLDTQAPALVSVERGSLRAMYVNFNSAVSGATALAPATYAVSGAGLGTLTATPDHVTNMGGGVIRLTWNSDSAIPVYRAAAPAGDISVNVLVAFGDNAGNLLPLPASGTDSDGPPTMKVIELVADDDSNNGPGSLPAFIQSLYPDYTFNYTGGKYRETLTDDEKADLQAADLVVVSRNANSGGYSENVFWNTVLGTPMINHYVKIGNDQGGLDDRWRWNEGTETNHNVDSVQVTDPSDAVFSGGPTPLVGYGTATNPLLVAPGSLVVWNNVYEAHACTQDDVTGTGGGAQIAVLNDPANANGPGHFCVRWQQGDAAFSTQLMASERLLLGSREFQLGNADRIDEPTNDLTDAGYLMYANAYNSMLTIPLSIQRFEVRNADLTGSPLVGWTNQTDVLLSISYFGPGAVASLVVDITEYQGGISTTTLGVAFNAAGIPFTLSNAADGVTSFSVVLRSTATLAATQPREALVELETVRPDILSARQVSSSVIDIAYDDLMGLATGNPVNYTASGPGQGTLAAQPNLIQNLGGNTYRLIWNTGSVANSGILTVTMTWSVTDKAGNALTAPTSADINVAPIAGSYVIEVVTENIGNDAPMLGFLRDMYPLATINAVSQEYRDPLTPAEKADLLAADLVVVTRHSSSGDYDAEIQFWNELAVPTICHTPSNTRDNRWRWFTDGEFEEFTTIDVDVTTPLDAIYTGGTDPLIGNPIDTTSGLVRGWAYMWLGSDPDGSGQDHLMDLSGSLNALNGTVIGTMTNTGDSIARVLIARWAAGAAVSDLGHNFGAERVYFPIIEVNRLNYGPGDMNDDPTLIYTYQTPAMLLMLRNAYHNLLAIPVHVDSMTLVDADGAGNPQPGYTNDPTVSVLTQARYVLPDGVQLSQNDFLTLTTGAYGAPVAYALDTSSTTEGLHSLSARFTKSGFVSNTLAGNITLDQTPAAVWKVVVSSSLTVDVAIGDNNGGGPSVLNPASYTLSGSGQGTLLNTPNSVRHLGGDWYRLTWSAGRMNDGGDVTILANVNDVAGNNSATSSTHVGGGVGVPVTCTIDVAAHVTSPTAVFPIDFDVVFSQGVTGFGDDPGDVAFSGGTVTVDAYTVTPIGLDGRAYLVSVTALTLPGGDTAGTVVARVPAGVALSGAGSPNNASTSTGSTVYYDSNLLGVSIVTADAPLTSGSVVTYTVDFSEAVDGFTSALLSLIGTSSGSAITTVTETAAAKTWTVEIDTGADGLLNLALLDDGISDAATGAMNLNGPSTGLLILGNPVNVLRNSPTIAAVVRTAGAPEETTDPVVSFTVTFTQSVTGVSSANFTAASGVPGAALAGVFGVGNTYEVIVNVGVGEGPLTLALTDGAGIVNQIGLSYVPGAPDPNEIYRVIPPGLQTRAVGWSIYE